MRLRPLTSLVFAALTTAALADITPLETWREVLSPPQGEIPPPSGVKVEWRTDFDRSLEEAKSSKRPLLVTWRCLPCKQCAAFDKDVLEGGPEMTPLLKQFVTVRMTDAGQLDERYFPYRGYQDLDLSWWAYFLSPEGRLYGVFGGKDHVSDTTRISTAAFANAMRRVLAHHYDPRRTKWASIDGVTPDASKPKRTPLDNASYAKFREARPWMQEQTCLHCHQVNDVLNFDGTQKDGFDLKKYTQAWPLPENVGIHLDRDDGLLVTRVVPGSAAAKADIRRGDRLAMASERKLFGQADFRGALHRAPYDAATIPVAWIRDGEVKLGSLETTPNWRAGENAWRKSVYNGFYGPYLGFFPLHGPDYGKGRMSLRPYMGQGEKFKDNSWYPTGLRPGMEIVEVNGRSDDWDSRQFLAWFRLNHKAGDEVTVKTRGGKTFARKVEDPR